jgi:outer membrane receptor protein involved in Fe transport
MLPKIHASTPASSRALRRDGLSLALLAAIAATALPAFAQQAPQAQPDGNAPGELDRITVTAQKREQQIEDVPISINAYSGDFLQAQGIQDYGDLGTLVPGLEVQTQSVSNPSISIRGITADLDDPTQEPRISVFQDGVSISRARGSSVEMFDMQRVEVLRGPQGTLFGRAAETGAIHLIQNKARTGTSSGFDVGLGSDAQRRFTGFYNTDLGDNVQGRIAAFYETRDGFVENLDGGTLQGKDTRAIRGALHFGVGESGGFDLILNYQKDTPPGTAFRSQVLPSTRGSLDPLVANSQRGNELGTDREVYGATLLGDFRLNDNWSLSSITGWRRYDGLDKFDSDGSQADLIEFDEHAWGHQFSQELRFNFDNGGKFTGFVGGSFFKETSNRDLTYQTDERQLYALLSPTLNAGSGGLLPVIPLLNPDLTPNTTSPIFAFLPFPLNPDHRETFGNDVDIRAFDLFADGTWQFNDAWSLTVGLRGSHESVEYGYHADAGNGSGLGYALSARGAPICTAPAACTNFLFPATNGRLSASDSYTSWVGRAVLGWKVNDNLNTYASVSRGRRPDMLNVSDLGTSHVPAEIVWSYEVGMKGNAASGRFLYDLSLFYYDYDNFQASVKNASPPPFFVTTNAGKAHALGFEASLFAKLTDNVNGWVNYGYIDGGFNAFDGDGTYQKLAGNEFRMTPKQSVSLGVDWTIPLQGGDSLYLRPNYSWRSHVYFEDENQPNIEQDGYGLLGLRAGWRFGDHWDLGVWGNNLTNRKYLTDAGNTGLLFNIPTVIAGADRSYGVTLHAKF